MINSNTNLIEKSKTENLRRGSKSAMSRGGRDSRSEYSGQGNKSQKSKTTRDERIQEARNALIVNENKIAGIYNDDDSDQDAQMEEFDFNPQELEHVNKLRNDYKIGKSLIHR